MTDRRQLIRTPCLAVALSFAMALPTSQSEAQPMGQSLSQMQSQTNVLEYKDAQVVLARGGPNRGPRGRRGRRWGGGPRFGFGFGFGPRKHCWWGPRGRQCRWW